MKQIPAYKIVLHEIKFKVESIIRNKVGHFVMIKRQLIKKVTSTFMHLKNMGSEYKTQNLTELPEELDNSIT